MANLNLSYKTRYGLDFAANTHDIFIELLIAKKARLEPYCHGNLDLPGTHMLRAAKGLFTTEEWNISPWTEQHCHAFCDYDGSIWLGAASTSKAQPLDELVMTPTGPRAMGDIAPGDQVTGLDGTPIRVLKTHDAGIKPEFKVRSADGRTARCADDHLWTVRNRNSRYRKRTLPTSDLVPGSHMFPDHGVVQFTEQELPFIDPYVFGALLGDGTLGTATGTSPLSFTNVDGGVLARFRKGLPKGYDLAFTANATWRIVKESRLNNGANELIQALKGLGLWGCLSHTKFIPDVYLYGSEDVRRAVLGGLMDTDGTCDPRGICSFTSVSERLAAGVVQLVRSLGGKASVTVHKAGYKADGEYRRCRDAHTVAVSLPLDNIESLFPGALGKRAKALSKRSHKLAGVSSVTATGRSVPMQCLTVDSPDGLYLTGDFLPTHNSNDAGFLLFLYWMTDPTDTYVAMASTSVPMLKLRSFESVTRCYRILKRNPHFLIPGKEAPSQTAIVNENDDNNDATTKASLRGVALADGDQSKAVARLAGGHLPFTALCLDEGSALPPAASRARFNAAAGAQRFVFLSLANPTSFMDEASVLAEPRTEDGGWSGVDENTPEWVSRYGFKVLHHNGFNSPAITEDDGARKYPYLINKAQIDRMLLEVDDNDQDPIVWTMVRGFPSPSGLQNTVLSPADVHTFEADTPAIWQSDNKLVRVAGLDPAFSSGGDKAVLYPVDIGRLTNGLIGVHLLDPIRLPIDAGSMRPVSYQVVDRAVEHCKLLHIPYGSVGIDDSGTQSVADIWRIETGANPVRCNFGARPPGILPADIQKGARGDIPKAKYSNMVTELWALMAKLVRQGRVRGLRGKCQSQFTSRLYKKDKKPLALESKADYKKRSGGNSPDEADAAVVALLAAFRAGGMSLNATQSSTSWLSKPMAFVKQATGMNFYVDPHTTKGYGESRY